MRQPTPKSSLEFQAKHATERIQGTIRVRATRRGFYDNHVKEAGDVFTIREQDKLGSWMELVEDEPVTAPASSEESASDEQQPAADKPKAKGGSKKADAPATKTGNDVL